MTNLKSENIIVKHTVDWQGVQTIINKLSFYPDVFKLVIYKNAENDFTVHFITKEKVEPINFVALHDLFW